MASASAFNGVFHLFAIPLPHFLIRQLLHFSRRPFRSFKNLRLRLPRCPHSAVANRDRASLLRDLPKFGGAPSTSPSRRVLRGTGNPSGAWLGISEPLLGRSRPQMPAGTPPLRFPAPALPRRAPSVRCVPDCFRLVIPIACQDQCHVPAESAQDFRLRDTTFRYVRIPVMPCCIHDNAGAGNDRLRWPAPLDRSESGIVPHTRPPPGRAGEARRPIG